MNLALVSCDQSGVWDVQTEGSKQLLSLSYRLTNS